MIAKTETTSSATCAEEWYYTSESLMAALIAALGLVTAAERVES